ncbi:hypothetical protein psyc5s11_54520 [Clostridium gelidum]|uniref:DUF4097 domain-containing protein n=1 Tax=Clostridium gelidum TaxID=704125 RepID=A0ABM7TC66_9CLOT|nr:DUF4097 family beta strand repeat-containing protein [Clostridium gelidum]BCZ49385.1 hypothetical protein psyc5s11_54520 [Clostridium gelidum]
MKIKINIKIIVIGVIIIMGIFGLGALFSYKEINEEEHFSMEDINEMQVNMTSEPVHIIRTEASNEVKFHLYGKSMQDIKLTSEINNKKVVVGAKRNFEGPIPEDMFLDIYVPEEYVKNLSIKISSGAVKMDSFDLANFTLNTSSGKLDAKQLNAEKISINSSSGSLNIKKLDAKELEIKGESSVVNIDECIAKDARIETSSGSITLKNSNGNFNIKGKSTKVMVAYKEFKDQNINIETSSGSVILEIPSTAEFLIEATTSSGKFQSDFPINTAGNTDKKKINGQIGMKNNKVLLQTSSGSIKILKK